VYSSTLVNAEGLRAYERALALDLRYSDPVASLAKSAEEEHRLDDARRLAERALQVAPQNTLAALTLAGVKLRQDDAAGATTILEALLRGGGLSATNRIVALATWGRPTTCRRVTTMHSQPLPRSTPSSTGNMRPPSRVTGALSPPQALPG
jgi:tetratricopeptide (TPR) repeat protein